MVYFESKRIENESVMKMGLFDRFRRIKKAKKRRTETKVIKKKKIVEKPKEILDLDAVFESKPEPKMHKKLDLMDQKLDDLLEIKNLYEDMLDWIVQLAKSQRESKSRLDTSTSRDKIEDSSILSPRLQQILDIIKERGETLATEVSSDVGLSKNRCSELLNALYRANYVEKKRVGREVYYRFNPGTSNKFIQFEPKPKD